MISVRIRYRKDRNYWQAIYRSPETGKEVSRQVPEGEDAKQFAANWEASLNAGPHPNPPPRKNPKPLTPGEFAAVLGAVPGVVGEEHADAWIRFLVALRAGVCAKEAIEREHPTHPILTMSLANIARVIAEMGKRAGTVVELKRLRAAG